MDITGSLKIVEKMFNAYYSGDNDEFKRQVPLFSLSYDAECGISPGEDGCMMDRAKQTLEMARIIPVEPKAIYEEWKNFVSLVDKYMYGCRGLTSGFC